MEINASAEGRPAYPCGVVRELLTNLEYQLFSVRSYLWIPHSFPFLHSLVWNSGKDCIGKQLKVGWDKVLWFQWKTFSLSPLATTRENKELQLGGFLLLKSISVSFRMGKIIYLHTQITAAQATPGLWSNPSGKLAQLVETNSTVFISYSTSMSLHSDIRMPENAHNHTPHRATAVLALLVRRSAMGGSYWV